MNAVEIMDVTKKYGDRVIFDHINMEIREGEMTALIGPSGCGKSTLLNMIGLLEDLSNGKIRIFGKEIPKINSRKATMLRRNTVNYLFQSSALVGDMTVYQNLMLAMHFVRISQKEKEIRINRMLHEVGLPKMKSAVVNTMSGGEQQRVALARTLLKPGKLILADEPTGALDEKSAEKVFLLLRDLCVMYKKTVIMVTHNMELARKADRVVNLMKYEGYRG